MIEFAWPWALLALPLPFIVALLGPRALEAPNTGLRVPFFHAIEHSQGTLNGSRIRLFIAILAWLLLSFAAARPQLIGEALRLPLSGRDLLLAVDISGSMNTEDMMLNGAQTDRLSVVQAVAGDFIERRESDRLGLILFGSRAYLQTPLTFDRKTVRTLLDEAEIGLAGRETAIGDAIGLAVKRLRERDTDSSRVLILLTDGANNAGEVNPRRATALAVQQQIRIYTIGVGADEMTVRGAFGNSRINPSADLDETMLREIAAETGGRYFRARDSAGLIAIYQLLDELEPAQIDEQIYRPVNELYYWPLALALLLSTGLALAACRPGRRRRQQVPA
jgi:Ca-activated chloride channel family protein